MRNGATNEVFWAKDYGMEKNIPFGGQAPAGSEKKKS